jgi:hypothetical protein
MAGASAPGSRNVTLMRVEDGVFGGVLQGEPAGPVRTRFC